MQDFEDNEKTIMDSLDGLAKAVGGKKKKGNVNEAADGAEQIRQWRDQIWPLDVLEEKLGTKFATGLTNAQVDEKRRMHGWNSLTEKDKVHPCILFLKEQTGFFSLLLWFGSFLCFIAFAIQEDKSDESNLYLGIVLAVVVFTTGVFSYSQSAKADSLMEEFKNMIPPQAGVKRNGEWVDLEAR